MLNFVKKKKFIILQSSYRWIFYYKGILTEIQTFICQFACWSVGSHLSSCCLFMLHCSRTICQHCSWSSVRLKNYMTTAMYLLSWTFQSFLALPHSCMTRILSSEWTLTLQILNLPCRWRSHRAFSQISKSYNKYSFIQANNVSFNKCVYYQALFGNTIMNKIKIDVGHSGTCF